MIDPKPPTEPLSGVDRAWLRMDSHDNPMVITGFFAFDEPMDVPLLRTLVDAWADRFPRFRQRASADGLRWEQAELDLEWHVAEEDLPAVTDEDFRRFVSSAITRPLPPDRPLWKMTVVDRPGGGSAVFFCFHHALGDGIALTKVLLALCDQPPEFDAKTGSAGAGPRIPTRLNIPEQALDLLRHPSHLLDLWGAAAPWAGTLARLTTLSPDPPTGLKGGLAGAKQTAWMDTIPLDAVKAAGRRHGATINDLLMAAVSGALRRYVLDHGFEPQAVRALIPVNLRPRGGPPRLGNYFGLVLPSLPLDEADPLGRLHRARAEMLRIKRSVEAPISFALLQAIGHAASAVEEEVMRFFGAKASLVLTNVPGPRTPLSLAGRTITDLMFWVPQAGDLGLGVSVMSYNGGIRVGVMTDAGVIPDPERLVRGVEEELTRLGVKRGAS